MKKILSIVLAATLCVCCLAFGACFNFFEDVNKLLERCDTEKTVTANAAANMVVEVESDIYRIYVYETENTVLSVKYGQNSKTTVTMQVETVVEELAESTVIKVTETTAGEMTYKEAKNAFLLVGVPKTWTKCNLKVTADVGFVSVSDMRFKSMEITTATGAIDIEDCKVENAISVSADTGAVNVIAEAKSLTVKTETGSINAEGKFAGEVSLTADTGAISADLSAKSFIVSVRTGSVNFETAAEAISVTSSTGSVRGTIEGDKSLYTITVRTGTGSCNISNQSGDGTHSLDVETDTGSIKIKFN